MAKQSLLLSMVKNQYDFLEDTSDKDNSTNSPVRKAQKKLREINKLKNKKNKTSEELEKIMQEPEWLAIVNSECEVTSENHQDVLLRKEKQHQKHKQALERKINAQEKQMKRLEQENQKLKQLEYEHKKLRLLEQENKKLRLLEQENKKLRLLEQENQNLITNNMEKDKMIKQLLYKLNNKVNQQNQSSTSTIEKTIQEDFNKKCYMNPKDNPENIWRKWMIKYHPDKLSKVLGKDVANEIGKIATELKP